MRIIDIRHPDYRGMLNKWIKWRSTYEAGDDFLDTYLKYYTTRETAVDFTVRKSISYVPAFAKTAVEDVRKAIFSRANDIRRQNGSDSYQRALAGLDGGVDEQGSSMNGFIGEQVLTELLPMARVGVYVDMHSEIGATMATLGKRHPYLYTFATEDILSWNYDSDNKLKTLLLRVHNHEIDAEWGLPCKNETVYRYIKKNEKGILIQDFREDNTQTKNWQLNIPEIPFVIIETKTALMADIANYQIALLNIASSDVNYVTKSNFPFYVEQYDPKSDIAEFLRKATEAQRTTLSSGGTVTTPIDGTASEADTAKNKEVLLGVAQGRRYPTGADAPQFIHPSPEPLKASMEKQENMKKEIRQLVSLSLSNLRPKMQSAESKELDNEGLISGLAYLGVMLEMAERQIAQLWHMYENKPNDTVITYPRQYTLQTENERADEASKKAKVMITIPSKTYQKMMAKDIAQITIGHKVDPSTMDSINEEIDSANVMNTDPEFIIRASEAGLVGNELASTTIGFPEGEAKKAAIDHAERLARIAEAQSEGKTIQGVNQTKDGAKDQKKLDQDGNNNPINNKNKTRGAK